MGLRDILTGMQNAPRGQPQPSSGGGGGGTSPIVIASWGCLLQGVQGPWRPGRRCLADGPDGARAAGGTAQPGNAGGGLGDVLGGLFGGKPASAPAGTTSGGGLGDLLSGGLGGLLGGAAAGSVLSGGLGNLIRDSRERARSCRATPGLAPVPTRRLRPNDLADALGSDTLDTLSQRTGMGQNELLEALRHQLPGFVDQLTPHGRIPTEEEASRMV